MCHCPETTSSPLNPHKVLEDDLQVGKPLCTPILRGDSGVPITTLLVIIRPTLYVTETLMPLFNPSRVKILNWKICFLHLTIAVTQLSNLSCPGNTTAMNTSLGREEAIHVPVTFHMLQRDGGECALH